MLSVLWFLVVVAVLLGTLNFFVLRPPATGLPAKEGISRGTQRTEASPESSKATARLAELQALIENTPLRTRLSAARDIIDAGILGTGNEAADFGVELRDVKIGNMNAQWVLAPNADPNARLLYSHGGAFAIGSVASHRGLAASFAKRTGFSVLLYDYRLMPENTRLAGIKDAHDAYRWILDNGPNGPAQTDSLYLAGDSAGGSLTLMLLAWSRDANLRQADRAVALSPNTDSTGSSPSMREHIATDPMLGPSIGKLSRLPNSMLRFGVLLLARMRPDNPLISPVYGDLSNLPPTLIQASECEMLLDDSRRWVSRARAQGTDARLETWPGMVHVWQMFEPLLPEAGEAMDRLAKFLREGYSDDGTA